MEKKFQKEMYLFAAAYIIMGIWMVIFPQFTLEMICYLFAAVLAVLGIFNIIMYFSKDVKNSLYRHDFAGGAICILIAIVMIWKSQMFINIIPLVMGIIIFANGVMKLQRVLDLKRIGYSGWVFVLLFALLSICVGIFVMFQPDFIAKAVIIIIGISLIFSGITDVMTLIVMKKQVSEYLGEDDIVDSTATEGISVSDADITEDINKEAEDIEIVSADTDDIKEEETATDEADDSDTDDDQPDTKAFTKEDADKDDPDEDTPDTLREKKTFLS
ncbi:MAG: DUF308 domain-containing protein [Lachnospiraceae bacterium]|nr:DUF308 domain-containing protein [Lachnospiraceae bacterium]